MPRMRILNTSEQTGIERPPVFTSSERKQHFDFSQSVLDMAEGLRGKTNQVGFLLAYCLMIFMLVTLIALLSIPE